MTNESGFLRGIYNFLEGDIRLLISITIYSIFIGVVIFILVIDNPEVGVSTSY